MSYLGNLVAALVGRPRAETFDLKSMSPEMLKEFLRIGGGWTTASGVTVTESSTMRVAAAWRSVNIIAGTIGTLPMDVIKRQSEEVRLPAIGHPLRRVLTLKPNGWQTPGEFRRMMQAHLLLRGNGYALKAMSGRHVAGLIPLHPDRVEPEQLDDMTMEYKVRTRDNRTRVYGPREIFHLRGLTLDGVKGLSVMSHMRESLGLALTGEQAAAALMKNGSFNDRFFTHPGVLSDAAAARLKKDMDEYRGSGNAGKIPLLEEGLKVETVGLSATDLQFLEQRDFQRYDIAMFFGVPPHMLGATEKQTSWGSGIEQQGIGFVTYTLNDWIRTWEETVKRDLLPEGEWETHDFKLFPQGLMRGDVKTRQAFYTAMLQWGVMSPDEVRALEDMNPRADGNGDVYYPPPNTAGGAGATEGAGDEPPNPA